MSAAGRVQPYVPLWCKSSGSFLEGASAPEELVERAHALGLGAIAITDRDGLYGVVQAHVRARELGVKLLVGSEVTVAEEEALEAVCEGGASAAAASGSIVLLAADREGYGRLCRLITIGRRRCPKGRSVVSWEELCAHAQGLVALCCDGRLLLECTDTVQRERLGALREAFGDALYAMCVRHGAPGDGAIEARVRKLGLPVVAGREVLYHDRVRRALHDVLTAIRCGVSVQRAGRRLRPNAEHDLVSAQGFWARWRDDPAAIARTREVAERLAFSLDALRYRYPSERLPDGTSSIERLRALGFAGARERYGCEVPARVRALLERELALIEELEYPGYFLTMHEIVSFCRQRGILCQGRGSAANSALCFCLGITAVDPMEAQLLFERFVSRERAEPPDIDLDIAHERREEVIEHVYERYGREHAAMVANVVRYRLRSAIRDVGKALDMPLACLERLARLAGRSGERLEVLVRHAGLDPRAPVHRHFVSLVEQIEGLPRHLSIHPGGFVLGHEPVSTLVPVENGAMAGRTVIQWDKRDIEALGLFKVDLLGLGALSMIDRCLRLVREHEGKALSLATLPRDDEATFSMLRRADTIGVFQLESRAQMSMLPRLLPRTFYDLVIEISIVRPGPIAGDMVHPYLRRRNGEEAVTYPHPALEPVLARTLGVPLFQEQVMRIAMLVADYTPGEADQLRRDMAAWRRRGRIERHRERLVARMKRNGIEERFAERIFEQIRGFGEYGFPESHAASFALIAYASAYLRCHHLEAFVAALLNAQPMGFYSPSTIVEDARRHGVEMRPVCVVNSAWDCTLEAREETAEEGGGAQQPKRPFAVRMGLRYVRGLGEQQAARLLEARARAPFEDLEDFVRRSALDRRALETLAQAGALERLGCSRREALWRIGRLVRTRSERLPLRRAPEQAPAWRPLTAAQCVAWDHEAAAHSVRGHLFEAMRERLRARGFVAACELAEHPDGAPVRYAGLVICRQRPQTAGGVVFMSLEDETGLASVVLWPKVFARHEVLARTASLLGVYGRVQKRGAVVHLIARRLFAPQLEARLPNARSRNFH